MEAVHQSWLTSTLSFHHCLNIDPPQHVIGGISERKAGVRPFQSAGKSVDLGGLKALSCARILVTSCLAGSVEQSVIFPSMPHSYPDLKAPIAEPFGVYGAVMIYTRMHEPWLPRIFSADNRSYPPLFFIFGNLTLVYLALFCNPSLY